MDAGRRLERSLQLLALLRATLDQARNTATDSLLLESVLTVAESIITYRRRYRSHAQLQTLLDLLLVDEDNPRSVGHNLSRLAKDLDAMPPDRGARPALETFLSELTDGLLQTAEAVERIHVVHRLPQRRLPPP